MSWGTKIIPRELSAKQVLALNKRIDKEEKMMVKAFEKEKKEKEEMRLSKLRSKKHSRSEFGDQDKHGSSYADDREAQHHRHRHRRHHRHGAGYASDEDTAGMGDAASQRGSTAPSLPSTRPSRSLSSSALLSRSSSSSRPRTSMPPLPDDLKGLGAFPLTTEYLMKLRVTEDASGRMPKLRFKVRHNEAQWVPGSKSFVDYEPEFYLE
eukprot:TRINITY_DN100293_c0_g1_i1.p1 TRINITY_DN100293_c0_g1~~TRINITY_DN100293_c0_g1_i1.p1  ORF type:complete len:209 (+),score=46.04 TRINITY_DN100293_c0_g1_i1:91-717(+)